MELSYNQLETTLSVHFQIHPDKLGTFRSRIKQLQRLHFPPGVNVGRGAKMSYSAEHLFQLVSAFELINLGLPAFTATSIVENNWREIAAGFGLAIHEEFDDSRSRGAHRSIYLRIMQISLSSLMEEANEEVGAVFVEDLERLRMELEEEPEKPATSYLLLCASDIARNVLYAARRIAKVSDPETDEEFATWHTRLSPYAWWMLEGVEQTGED